MKAPRKRSPPKPRNVAARALASGQFRPKVEPDPKAYRRRAKHKSDVTLPSPGEEPDAEK